MVIFFKGCQEFILTIFSDLEKKKKDMVSISLGPVGLKESWSKHSHRKTTKH